MKNKKLIFILGVLLIAFITVDIYLVVYNKTKIEQPTTPNTSEDSPTPNLEPSPAYDRYRCFASKEFNFEDRFTYTISSEYEFSVNLENLKIYNGHFNDTFNFKSKEDFEIYAEELKNAISEDIANQFSYNDSNNTIVQDFSLTLNSENPLTFSNAYFDYLEVNQDYTNCQKIN